MTRGVSAAFTTVANSTAAGEAPRYLLEITHADLVTPIRIVDDTDDLVHQGDTFTAYAFDIVIPDDTAGKLSRARLVIDNIGRELTQWLEASAGGQGAQARIIQVLRSAPDVVEWEMTLDFSNLAIDLLKCTWELGYEDLLGQQAIALTYRPDTAPGLF